MNYFHLCQIIDSGLNFCTALYMPNTMLLNVCHYLQKQKTISGQVLVYT